MTDFLSTLTYVNYGISDATSYLNRVITNIYLMAISEKNSSISSLKNEINTYNRIVIWGLRTGKHTHRYIHSTYFHVCKRLGLDVLWLNDNKRNAKYIKRNDLIISANVCGKYLPILDDAFYCLHNFSKDYYEKVNPSNLLLLQVFTTGSKRYESLGRPCTYFDDKTQTLFQPWGTDLLPWEFMSPVFHSRRKSVFWVGSIWNNDLNQGNVAEIERLKEILSERGLRFIPIRGVPDSVNRFLIRNSKVSPSIAGLWQVDNGYLPCRMFKNISYGQIGITNVTDFSSIFGNSPLISRDIEKSLDYALSLDENQYHTLVQDQQEMAADFTYLDSLLNICNMLHRIRS